MFELLIYIFYGGCESRGTFDTWQDAEDEADKLLDYRDMYTTYEIKKIKKDID